MKIIRENRESAGNNFVIKMSIMGQIYLISGNVVPPCSLQGTEAFPSPQFVAEFVNNIPLLLTIAVNYTSIIPLHQ